jgi:hypothetical protein
MEQTKLLLQFNKMEEARLKLYSRITAMEEKMLHRRESEGKWSAIQIIFHLSNSEEMSVAYIGKKVKAGNSIPKTGLSAEVRILFLRFVSRYKKLKKPAWFPEPPENPDTKIILDAWSETRDQLKQLIVKLPDDMLERKIFRHPLAGRLNIRQALTSLQLHFDHHLKQINSLLKRTDLISS